MDFRRVFISVYFILSCNVPNIYRVFRVYKHETQEKNVILDHNALIPD